MAQPAMLRMTPDEFFQWQLGQDGLYELVDGLPVPHVKMMTGASAQHDRATVNIIATLHAQLRGSGCRPTTDDIALRTGIATLRRPDVTVECADLVRDTYESRSPRLVVEVLSPSTSSIDRFPGAVLYCRREDAWEAETYEAMTDIIDLPEIGARLALADIYDDVAFEDGRADLIAASYHMSSATRASSDIRLWSHGGSNTIVTVQD